MAIESIGSIDDSPRPFNIKDLLVRPPEDPSDADAHASQIADALRTSGTAAVFVTRVDERRARKLEDELTQRVGKILGEASLSTQRETNPNNRQTHLIIFSVSH